MARMSVEIEGSVEEVIGVLRRLGTAGRPATVGDADRSIEKPADGVGEMTPATGTPGAAASDGGVPREWTAALARDFLSGLQPMGRRLALHPWRAGAAGIHRSTLCQRADLTPAELRSTLMRMGHALRRFQQVRGITLSRPLAANSPLQSYFVAADFAAVANAQMFGDGITDRLADDGSRA